MPVDGGRIDAVKSRENCGAERSESDNAPSFGLAPQGKPVGGERDKDGSSESNKRDCDFCIYVSLLPLFIVALWAGIAPTMKHNS
jgi:hypothetical protein